MKDKILITIHYLELGGAEISLIGLLKAMDYSRYDVDLFVYSHRGALMQFIPKEVHLLSEIPEYAQLERSIKSVLKDGYFRIAARRLIAKVRARRWRKQDVDSMVGLQCAANLVTPILPLINPDIEYDLAVSFLTPHNIVRDKVLAKRRAAWIHTDYSVVQVDAKQELKVWDAFDHIVSISDEVTKAFVSVFPQLEPKIAKIENILSPAFVRQRSDEYDANADLIQYFMDGNPLKLLTIGRFCYQKNMDNIPSILSILIEELKNDPLMTDLSVYWFIIGYGPDASLVQSKIAEAGMGDRVILLGKKSNPYPYIKACDIYVQPSRYEGKAVTVREAQILGKPVVITNYPTAKSQVCDGLDGVIVPQDNQGCAKGLFDLIKDIPKQKEIISYLQEHDYGNESEIEKIYSLIPR